MRNLLPDFGFIGTFGWKSAPVGLSIYVNYIEFWEIFFLTFGGDYDIYWVS
jgi:hypothetical protein